MKEKTLYGQWISMLITCVLLVTLGILFIVFCREMPLICLISGIISILGIIVGVVIEFFGIGEDNAKAYIVIMPITYISSLIFVFMNPKMDIGAQLILLVGVVKVIRDDRSDWKKAIEYVKKEKGYE